MNLREIINHGTRKHPTRKESGETKNATIGLPNIVLKRNLEQGFPLLITRKINFDAMVGELRSFLEGRDNNNDFESNGCNFWKPWAGKNGDLGPIYGVQWNKYDQLQHVLDNLKHQTDRRMVVSAWNPPEHADMALPPCHLMWVVTPYDGKVNLSWIQRSADFPIGVPYNIASYALLTHLLAEWSGLVAGSITATFCDAHIYDNQIKGVELQLSRAPKKLPKIEVWFEDLNNFNSWQCKLSDYNYYPNINFGKVEV